MFAWVSAGALLLGAAACASGPKKKPPMEPESATGTDDTSSAWSDSSGEGGVAAASDSDGGAPASDGTGGGGGKSAATEEGAKTLLDQFVQPGADVAALTKSLKPTTADYGAIFDAELAPKVEAALAKDWDSGKVVIDPKPKQKDLKIVSATGADLASGSAKDFPGGYKTIGKHLTPTVTVFKVTFSEPGKKNGKSFEGLSNVNGHWVFVPKPWRAGADKPAGGGGKKKKK